MYIEISNLPETLNLDSSSVFPVVFQGETKKVTFESLQTVLNYFTSVSYNKTTGQFTFTRVDGTGALLSTDLNSSIKNASLSNGVITFTKQDDSPITVDLKDDLQTKITISNKLNSDLVNDDESANKFVTSEEKTQIATNTIAINNIKNGVSIDCFSDVEVALESKADTATTLAGYGISDAYTKTEVDIKISAVYKYKGTVSTYNDLPSTNLTIGDVYNIETADSTHGVKAGDNVAWNGTAWDVLAGTVDLSGYQTKIDSSHKLESDLVDDTNQTNKFVTTSEKTTWNAKYVKPSGGIPTTDLSSAVQTSLGKADSALQEHQDISGKEDKTNKVTSIDENSTDTQYPSAKLLYDQLAEKQAEIDGLVTENTAFKKQISTAHISTTSTQLTDSAEDLQIENVKLKGQTSQEQYEGYNLWGGISYTKSSNSVNFEQKSDGSMIVNGTSTGNASSLMSADAISNGYTKTLSAGTYVLSGGTSNVLLQVVRSDGNTVVSTTSQEFSKTFTLSAETVAFVRATVGNGVTVNNETVYIQLEEGSTAHDWEPYVGGQPAPNPAYPQLIHRVTGNCASKFQNKNLFVPTLKIDDTNIVCTRCTASVENDIMKFTATSTDWYFGEVSNIRYTVG